MANNSNIQVLSDGTGEEQHFTYIVDPNPLGNDAVNQDDLYCWVSLKAYPKNRSIITTQGDYANYDKEVVNLIASQKFTNGKNYLSTDYTLIGGVDSDDECFGVESIYIKTGANQVSRVNIKFIDAQGGSLFNNHEILDGKGSTYNNSKYNVFFRKPYSIFELTVKGYYGKPVTYYLNLTDVNFSFSAENSSWIGEANFIPYNYAFLSDISIKQVVALNSSKLGQSYLNQYIDDGRSLLRIDKMLKSFENLNEIFDNFKKDNKNADTLKNIVKSESILTQIQTNLGLYSTTLQSVNIKTITENSNYSLNNIIILDIQYKEQYESFLKKINIDIQDYNTTIATFNQTIKINNFLSPLNNITYKRNQINDVIKTTINLNNPTLNIDNFDDNLINNILVNGTDFFIIDLNKIRLEVSETSINLKGIKNKYYEDIVKDLNSKIESDIGFTPTIYEIFRILCGNVDIFLQILYDTAVKADSLSTERIGYLNNYFTQQNNLTNIPFSENKIYPFPIVYDEKGELAWIGDIVGENNEYYPEINLVNQILSGMVNKNDKVLNDEPLTNFKDLNLKKKWFFIHPFDITTNEYDNFNNFDVSNKPSKDLISIINKRFVISSYYSQYNNIYDLANLDATYFYKLTENQKIQQLISSYSEQEFIDELVSQNTFNDSFILNGFNLDKNYFLEVNKNDYNKVENVYDEISTFVNKKNLLNIAVKNRNGHYKTFKNNIIIKDLTDFYNDSALRSRIYSKYKDNFGDIINENTSETKGYFNDLLTELQIFDGYINKTDDKTNNQFLKIGLSVDKAAYNTTDKYLRSLLFLQDFPFYNLNSFVNQIKDISCLLEVNHLYLAYLGGLIHFNIDVNPIYSTEFKNFLLGYFTDFTDNIYKPFKEDGLEANILKYRVYAKDKIFDDVFENTYNNILNVVFVSKTILVNSPIFIYNESYRSSNYLKKDINTVIEYGKQWYQWFQYYYNRNLKTVNKPITNSVTDDKDLKIVIYSRLQMIYDSWLAFGKESHKIYNFPSYLGITDKDNRRLIDHFIFVDRNYSDIGSKAVINPNILSTLYSKTDMNMYGFIGEILKESKFVFTALPTKVEYTNKSDVANIFKPLNHFDFNEKGSSYICMWTGGNSQVLNIDENSQYYNDGFDLRPYSTLPVGFLNRTIPNRYKRGVVDDLKVLDLQKIKNQYNMAAFRVGFSDQNQSIFKSIDVNQSEHKITLPSAEVQSELFDGKGSGKRLYKGLDLYNYYMKQSYLCSVTCMGSMQILPMMYFQLDNVPMFHGCYIIYNVEHNITPNNVETKFSGRRLQRYSYPIIDKVTMWFNFTIEDFLKDEIQLEPQSNAITALELKDGSSKFERAINKALDNEGGYEAEGKVRSKDGGNYYKGEFYGTTFGVTAQFIKDFLKKEPTKDYIKNLSRNDAKTIWYNTAWQWMKGEQIKDQYVIDLMLDWMIQAQGRCTAETAKILGYSKTDVKIAVDKLYFSDKMVTDINNFNGQLLHDKLKNRRLDYVTNKETSQHNFVDSITRRINRYVYL